MTQGTIVGGWQYVWMAYGLTFAVFAIYGVSLFMRLVREKLAVGGWRLAGDEARDAHGRAVSSTANRQPPTAN